MRRILTAVAALALVAGGSLAQAQGNGKGNDRGGGKPAAAGQGGGGSGGSNKPAQAGGKASKSDRRFEARGNAQGQSGDRGNSQAERADRGNGNAAVRTVADDRGRGNNGRSVIERREVRIGDDRRGGRDRDVSFVSLGSRGLIDGCPPGLAKKRNGCQPPGQAGKNDWSSRLDRPDWWGLSGLADGRYVYRDGYLLRLGDSGIGGYVPLLGGALGVGNAWPSYYEPVALPNYYERYYGLGSSNAYRYANDVIYRVDPETSAITSIAALLTGQDFSVGNQLPLGYDAYNVPYNYRDQYYDTPDALYRYNDGYVYQVDPTTKLIAAAIELIT